MIEITLPIPWENKKLTLENIPKLMFLVGPNGSGKTRFADQFKNHLPNCRILSADRLSGLSSKHNGYDNVYGTDIFEKGFSKDNFANYKTSNIKLGYGSDAFILLEEKYDLRIQIEATLSQLLNRDIRLEWDSGRLMPMAYNRESEKAYKLHKDECHGIKEILILLTHLYDDSNESLIIDEPELNLHPQFQSYLIQEIRRVINSNKYAKNNVILITHSPFILDIRSVEDLKSILSFNTKFDLPSHLGSVSVEKLEQFDKLISQLNVHHKQLFFADNPIFVEGIFDSMFFRSLQNKRGESFEGAGSCIIDVGGNTQIVNYFYLSQYLGKKSFFIYDLDSLFTYKLRQSADTSDLIKDYLVSIGASDTFQTACSELEKELKPQINKVINEDVDENLNNLKKYLTQDIQKTEKDYWKKARTAFLVQLNNDPTSLESFIPKRKLDLIKSKFSSIVDSLKTNNVYLLPKGALENYLPTYTGNIYQIQEDKKRSTVENEIHLMNNLTTSELNTRYTDLFDILSEFPSSKSIDYSIPLKNLLSDIIYSIQKGINSGSITRVESISKFLGKEWVAISRVLNVENLVIKGTKFKGTIIVLDKWDLGTLKIEFNENTNPTKLNLNNKTNSGKIRLQNRNFS